MHNSKFADTKLDIALKLDATAEAWRLLLMASSAQSHLEDTAGIPASGIETLPSVAVSKP